ncbi:hypothetical protein GKZ89_19980 [Bacillus mangrovi]|uniref:Uncharacterized protein n=1 Tax=Metabacillus mangrovi TaxID=1491830 RepID=A0A7X2V790_9BACI|nr:hypothetical protein [Metabacillus mangrovi]MTH55678.1 hypothetical protein [Metabacillus mangrovi]
MAVKNVLNLYNLLLSMGAFYLGVLMLTEKGAFDVYPPEWIGKLPFTSWTGMALFGMALFGLGNAFASLRGFIKKDKVFLMTIMMGALFFVCTVGATMLTGEWYLPSGVFLIVSIMQILLGIAGFIIFHLLGRAAGQAKR